MSWQIGNEPRAFSDENKEPFARWMADVAAQIKSLDPNHMVSSGSEGSLTDIRFCAALRAVLICPLGHTDIHRCAALQTFYDAGQQMREMCIRDRCGTEELYYRV